MGTKLMLLKNLNPSTGRVTGTSLKAKRAALTIIELLVVIGVLTILASILLPALQKSYGRAESFKAKTDAIRLANVWHAYFSEYNKWPITNQPAAGTDMDRTLVDLLTLRTSQTDALNPKKIIFLKDLGEDVLDASRNYVDPWLTPYKVLFDLDFDGSFEKDGLTNHVKVLVWSLGPDGLDGGVASDDNENSWD